jgi:hypothetical protein
MTFTEVKDRIFFRTTQINFGTGSDWTLVTSTFVDKTTIHIEMTSIMASTARSSAQEKKICVGFPLYKIKEISTDKVKKLKVNIFGILYRYVLTKNKSANAAKIVQALFNAGSSFLSRKPLKKVTIRIISNIEVPASTNSQVTLCIM